jgi:serine/threonine protein kinase
MDSRVPERIGKYEIVSSLGEGGMGVVYKARDPLLDRVVALKTILLSDPEREADLLKRLTMEAKSAARLQHPNIVIVYDFGVDQTPFIAMEYVEGANLARLIADRAPMALDMKINIVTQLCDALSYAHELGVYHRDIKPSNICLTKKGAPKLLDFGLARFDDTRLTKTGMTSGTLAYISPERMQGETGPSDDLFALGAVAYEIFTGERAFPGATYGDILRNMLSGRYPRPASEVAPLPKELDPILARAAALDRKERYQTAAELGKALEAFRASGAAASVPQQQSDEAEFATAMLHQLSANPYSAPELEDVRGYPQDQEQTAPVPALTHDRQITAESMSFAKRDDPTIPSPKMAGGTGATVAVRADAAQDAATVIATGRSARVVVADAATRSVTGTFRTVVARAMTPDTPDAPDAIARHRNLGFALGAVGITLLLAPLLLKLTGPIGYLALVAVGVGAWLVVLKQKASISLPAVLLIAVLLRLLTWVSEPAAWSEVHAYRASGTMTEQWTNPYENSTEPISHGPHAALLFLGWAHSGGELGAWRLFLLVVEMLILWMLFKRGGSTGALAYATFPPVILEASWNGNVQIVAAALIVYALLSLRRGSRLGSAAAIGLAGGINLASLAALPIARRFEDHSIRMLLAAALAFFPPLFFFATSNGTVLPRLLVNDVPTYAAAAHLIADQLRPLEMTQKAAALLANRDLTLPAWAADLELVAGAVVVIGVLLLFLTFLTKRSLSLDAAITNAIGLVLLVSGVPHPWVWLLIAPAAVLSNQAVWLFVLASSQLLYVSDSVGALILAYSVPWILLYTLRKERETATRLGLVFGSR